MFATVPWRLCSRNFRVWDRWLISYDIPGTVSPVFLLPKCFFLNWTTLGSPCFTWGYRMGRVTRWKFRGTWLTIKPKLEGLRTWPFWTGLLFFSGMGPQLGKKGVVMMKGPLRMVLVFPDSNYKKKHQNMYTCSVNRDVLDLQLSICFLLACFIQKNLWQSRESPQHMAQGSLCGQAQPHALWVWEGNPRSGGDRSVLFVLHRAGQKTPRVLVMKQRYRIDV